MDGISGLADKEMVILKKKNLLITIFIKSKEDKKGWMRHENNVHLSGYERMQARR
jgi:hypothetical protein